MAAPAHKARKAPKTRTAPETTTVEIDRGGVESRKIGSTFANLFRLPNRNIKKDGDL